jgi:uncharacterized membrane protein
VAVTGGLPDIDREYPVGAVSAEDPQVITAPEPGVVVRIETHALVSAAAAADCCLELMPAMGDFVLAGAPLLAVHGDGSRLDRAAITRLVVLGNERSHSDDPAYGVRKLVDIAEWADSSPPTIPPPRSRRSTGSTTRCASWPVGRSRPGSTTTRVGHSGSSHGS